MNELPTLVRVAATREGGAVRRCHIVPHHGLYNVAQHSYGAVSLLLILHPDPPLALIKAVQWHDVAERWLGDMPAPAKMVNAELAAEYELTEARILSRLGLLPNLTAGEKAWLRAVDVLDLWMWSREEERMGNGNVTRMRVACEQILAGLDLPEEAAAFYAAEKAREPERLSDFWPEVDPVGPE